VSRRYHRRVIPSPRARGPAALLILLVIGARIAAVNLDVTTQDIERALAIARSTEAERARFHAPYIRTPAVPLVERVEIITEYRRVELLAEERIVKGDRMFAYSTSLAQQAAAPWNRRVSIRARLRFHPQNTYADVPPAEIVLEGFERARIGVLNEPVMSMPSRKPHERVPVLGAIVESVFDASVLHDGTRDFAIRLEGKTIARVTFDLNVLE
jgi:hypothetical protein